MNYTPDELRQLRHQLELLQDVVGPAIHLLGVLDNGTVREYFEERDNTVEDATQLAKMCISLVITMAADTGTMECNYFHQLERFYEQALGSSLN